MTWQEEKGGLLIETDGPGEINAYCLSYMDLMD
jgi:hypothetical protein